MISCNRLLDHPISPECSKTTTTSTTTPTTTTPTEQTTTAQSPLLPPTRLGNTDENNKDGVRGFLPELIGGIAAGLLLIVIILLVFIIVMRKKRVEVVKEVVLVEESVPKSPTGDGESSSKRPPSSTKDEASILDEDEDDDDLRPKFASPVWIDEIQKNKIFNRQKSLLSNDDLQAELAQVAQNHNKSIVPQVKLSNSPTSKDDGEIRENSRTESDDDVTDPLLNVNGSMAESDLAAAAANLPPRPLTPGASA